MNGVERIIFDEMVRCLKHTMRVYRSMAERGAYPSELLPFQILPPFGDNNPDFLGIQGFMHIQKAVEAAEELLGGTNGTN